MKVSQICKHCGKIAFHFLDLLTKDFESSSNRDNILKLDGEKLKDSEFLLCGNCNESPFYDKYNQKLDFSLNLKYSD